MATATKTYKVVYTATAEWLDVAYPLSDETGIDWESEPIHSDQWDEVCELCEFDPEDYEVGFATLIEPRPCDSILRAGDIVATNGPGGDVAFLRLA